MWMFNFRDISRRYGAHHHHSQTPTSDAPDDAAVHLPGLPFTPGPQHQGAERQENLRRGKNPVAFNVPLLSCRLNTATPGG